MSLSGKTAIVTGASRGIGLAVSRELVREGAWVGMVARTEADVTRVAEEVGGEAIAGDVSSPAAVHALTTYVAEVLGMAPDLVVNCAGSFSIAPLAEAEPQALTDMLATNLAGPFLLMRAFLPAMLERRSGHFISIGSVAGRRPMPGNAAYSASKFGLRGIHEVLSEEIRGTGVRATLIEPEATDTPLWNALDPDSSDTLPSRSAMLTAEDVARAVLFAAAQPEGTEIGTLSLRANR